jgi:hypothetical protein
MKTRMTFTFTLAFSILLCSFYDANSTTFLVTNSNDAGPGSLRQAILDANANPGADVIDATGVAGTINITSELNVFDAVTINGPGAALLNVHGNASYPNLYGVFNIGNVVSKLSGLTISGGLWWTLGGVHTGAGINNTGQLDIVDCIISGNMVYLVGSENDGLEGFGGGIFNSGTLTVTNSRITDNRVIYNTYNPLGGGGGIYNAGTAYINNSVISSNECADFGGGIYNKGAMTIVNSAITDNVSWFQGGGIYNGTSFNSRFPGGPDVSLSITNCTISGNGFPDGISPTDAIYSDVPSLTMTNCICWANGSGVIITSTSPSSSISYSVLQGGCPGGVTCSNVLNVDPLFVSTTDLHLQPGSPAINAGTNTGAPATDFEGYPRIRTITDPADMGIYEANPVPYVSIGDKSIIEGNTGTFLMKFKVTLSYPYNSTIKIKYATADSTATAGSDYLALQGTISFAAGKISKTISITINGDATKEKTERFKVMLSKPQNAVLLDSLGIGTIKNDDAAVAFASQAATGTLESATAETLGAAVMPNPSRGDFYLNLHLPANKANTTLQLYNDLGVKVWQEDLGMVSGDISKNMYLENKLASGVYMLMVERNDARYSMKVVISK